jgi:hypothetical protein
MTFHPEATGTHPASPATDVERELHARIEGLQVQVRALGSAVDHLCRALDAATSEPPVSSEAAVALEEARLTLGRIW